MAKLDRISLHGFKSISNLENFELKQLNVLIGANGSGKSNFVDFFRMLGAMVEERFQLFVGKNGPADGFFFNGVSHTKRIEAELKFDDIRYGFTLEPTSEGKIIIAGEETQYASGNVRRDARGQMESSLSKRKSAKRLSGQKQQDFYVWQSLLSRRVYHFHDTSATAGMRRESGVDQGRLLQPDASNLPAYLLNLRDERPEHYAALSKTLRRIAPYFDDFDLAVRRGEPEDTVRLTWRRKGTDYIFSPGHFSDGTIRFLCLAAALSQPDSPGTIVLDEPELGLHPEALAVFAGLVRSAAARTQIILATQSPILLSEFEPDQIVTVDQRDGATVFRRLDADRLQEWLSDYTLGELWQKGTIAGGVNHA